MIAPPLEMRSREGINSLFLDNQFNPHPDQSLQTIFFTPSCACWSFIAKDLPRSAKPARYKRRLWPKGPV